MNMTCSEREREQTVVNRHVFKESVLRKNYIGAGLHEERPAAQ